MLLIITTKTDLSAFHVADWINSKKQKIVFVTEDSNTKVIKYHLNTDYFELEIDGRLINSNEIKAVWYRKTQLKLSKPFVEIKDDLVLQSILDDFIELESEVLDEMINSIILSKCVTINTNDNLYVNKLLQLKKAQSVGLNIPDTNILTKKNEIELLVSSENVITKGIYESFKCETKDKSFFSGTELLSELQLINYETFFPSLFQGYIDKQFEVRSFYLDGGFYSMAIFSQNNNKTSIDFRNYDLDNPNRMVSFLLPVEIEEKLRLFMESLELDCGSIDLIVTPDDKFYFLEVNPVGQFGFVSGLCNYNIEKKIANYLTKNEKSN